jgi:hypothetical protein
MEEKRYCFCGELRGTEMVECYNLCAREWFHFECVTPVLTKAPVAEWFCSQSCLDEYSGNTSPVHIPPPSLPTLPVPPLPPLDHVEEEADSDPYKKIPWKQTVESTDEEDPSPSTFKCDYNDCPATSEMVRHDCRRKGCNMSLHHICIDAAGVPQMSYYCSRTHYDLDHPRPPSAGPPPVTRKHARTKIAARGKASTGGPRKKARTKNCGRDTPDLSSKLSVPPSLSAKGKGKGKKASTAKVKEKKVSAAKENRDATNALLEDADDLVDKEGSSSDSESDREDYIPASRRNLTKSMYYDAYMRKELLYSAEWLVGIFNLPQKHRKKWLSKIKGFTKKLPTSTSKDKYKTYDFFTGKVKGIVSRTPSSKGKDEFTVALPGLNRSIECSRDFVEVGITNKELSMLQTPVISPRPPPIASRASGPSVRRSI